jgi:hypothetical protein
VIDRAYQQKMFISARGVSLLQNPQLEEIRQRAE